MTDDDVEQILRETLEACEKSYPPNEHDGPQLILSDAACCTHAEDHKTRADAAMNMWNVLEEEIHILEAFQDHLLNIK